MDLKFLTTQNTQYRKVLATAPHFQLVVQYLSNRSRAENQVPFEIHNDATQFVAVVSGRLLITIVNRDATTTTVDLKAGKSFVIPSGTWHQLDANGPTKFYTIYAGRPVH